MNIINTELKLPCGAILKNRIAKSAMSENMADKNHQSTSDLHTLYARWAQGGPGLLITGNVMIDSRALGEVHNVVIEKTSDTTHLKKWAEAGTQNKTHLWAQLNHPGKQTPKFITSEPVAPSAIALGAPLDKVFNRPRALSEIEIIDIIERFAFASRALKDAGFSGVQIHGAHGYLVSQFLSPLHNQRTDQWGGSLENRMRFVSEIYLAMRKAVGAQFPIGIKLNSADFQKGGFTQEDSIKVAQHLSRLGMDLIEISGGTYEAPAMMGGNKKESTKKREAYFLEYCEDVKKGVESPVMLTGGFRSLAGMEQALKSRACDVIGLARSVAINSEFPNDLLAGKNVVSEVQQLTSGFKFLDRLVPLEIVWYANQLQRMGKGLDPNANASVFASVFRFIFHFGVLSLKRVRA